MATLDEVIKECFDSAPEDAVIAYYNNSPSYWATEEVDVFRRSLEDAYVGCYYSREQFGQEQIDYLLEEMPEWLASCINYDDLWRYYFSHDFWEEDDYYFRNY
jgi:isocitrate dehydrogenase